MEESLSNMEGPFLTRSAAQTEALAEALAVTLRNGECVALFGGLGAGKTAFVRGLARGLGIDAEVSSPTFALVHEYRGGRVLYHYDMYRINSFDELYSTGFFDALDGEAILAVEWSENIENALPARRIEVRIEPAGEDMRRIAIRRMGETIPG